MTSTFTDSPLTLSGTQWGLITQRTLGFTLVFLSICVCFNAPSWARTHKRSHSKRGIASTTKVRSSQGHHGEILPTDMLKKGFWTPEQGTSPYRVIQNREFTKKGRFEIGLITGTIASDPFVSDVTVGAQVGYYLTEDLQVSVIGWRDFTGDSPALVELKKTSFVGVSSNSPKSYLGTGVEFSPIYGKVSVLGLFIAHYDLHVDLGFGLRASDTGTVNGGGIQNYLVIQAGVGQVFFLSDHFGLRFDYRMAFYNENIFEKVNPSTVGQQSSRLNRGDQFSIGLSAFL